MADANDNIEANSSPQPIALEDVIVALQKSFSRVSTTSALVPPEHARALVVGQVGFELTLRVEPENDNRLLYNSVGPMELKLTGQINTDIRSESLDEQQRSTSSQARGNK